MLCISRSSPDYRMRDSTGVQFMINFGSLPNFSQTAGKLDNSENQAAFIDESESSCSFKSEVSQCSGEARRLGTCDKGNNICPYRCQLEQDVQSLQQKLDAEMELHFVLENAVGHVATTLPNLSNVPHDAEELLLDIATLEVTVSKLEQQMVSLNYQLSQERNERRLAEYHLKQSSTQSLYLCSLDNLKAQNTIDCGRPIEDQVASKQVLSYEVDCSTLSHDNKTSRKVIPHAVDFGTPIQDKKASTQLATHSVDCGALVQDKKSLMQALPSGKLNKEISVKGLWNHPNQLSEEMVRCMKNIFISLADSSTASSKSSSLEGLHSPVSPNGHLSSLSIWSLSEPSTSASWVQSPQVDLQCNSEVLASENVFDPYKVRGKLSWADIGNYGSAIEVSWMSVGKKQLEYASGALRRFRLLVEQLAKVNPINLSNDEKLAFWINLYNALIMHAYLAYGVPRSDLKLFSLMQKAAYTVGGYSFNAATIEYAILKMKPPLHRPQTALLLALHKLKISDEQRKFSVDTCEPLVAFALSYGMYSSPAVRIYTPKSIREELQESQRDFIRASVGVSSKGKLLVPKMIHCFARGFVDDANLAVWISRFLPPQQAAFVEQCISKRRQSFLSSRNCGILTFDSRFRYLFLPETLL
ncbi:uncharacterized protein LOC131256560 isoform X2 [Magnolia sinica]|uniref:uncharacterized protein LOC131256560 isoform X2 n=1 Tax=Magnolia sinica TaxID=86752 RepID=UPI002658DC7A|nr:uncharacterized protein LOC131256560 isoform X2 [Magnolia sinica]XP_058113417.1 uncharacterized protein LOC131256560 isoform X2 [Magnolia sinica]XP_058113418.1 uncharacterized protein LOC131256560 isoform X2 [Magnolia sinica]